MPSPHVLCDLRPELLPPAVPNHKQSPTAVEAAGRVQARLRELGVAAKRLGAVNDT